jgi:hypothetical protein
MQITLFRALKGIRVDGDEAASIVGSLETHVESVVNNNIKAVEGRIATVEGRIIAVEGKIVSMQASIDALRFQIQFMTVMLGVIGLAIAAGPIITKFVH